MSAEQTFIPLQDIKLETIDFRWIQQTTKISHLKRAIKLIELDGNFFVDLKEACIQRIGQLDPSQKRVFSDNSMSFEDRKQLESELGQWEYMLQARAKTRQTGPSILDNQKANQQETIDIQSYFSNDPAKLDKTNLAQNERNKGNEAIKSKDYEEAIKYYTASIHLDATLPQAYANRALAHIKLKKFQRALEDCEEALKIDTRYGKAHHLKAKALMGLKNRVAAYSALQEALKVQPDNSEFVQQLKDLREEMNEEQRTKLEGQSKFKKVLIEQDSQQQQL